MSRPQPAPSSGLVLESSHEDEEDNKEGKDEDEYKEPGEEEIDELEEQNNPDFDSDGESIKAEWENEREISGSSSPVLDELMQMVGIKKVKTEFLKLLSKSEICKRQGLPFHQERFNVILQGSPGTGKTTIARLYGRFLQELKALPQKSLFRETTGAKLGEGGVKELQAILDEMKAAGGGLLFVDEAYQLDIKSFKRPSRPGFVIDGDGK